MSMTLLLMLASNGSSLSNTTCSNSSLISDKCSFFAAVDYSATAVTDVLLHARSRVPAMP